MNFAAPTLLTLLPTQMCAFTNKELARGSKRELDGKLWRISKSPKWKERKQERKKERENDRKKDKLKGRK